ncbi:MAG: methyl-accepting chemotaxis protein [Synergistaceae bacterium]|jgi:methyl-accepting chemotaxis protein|nr:methyl-accepting chemotaxis protein [Synergistaceae bacterium]
MSVKKKLLLSFLVIIIVTIVFGSYAVHSLSVMDWRVVDANDWAYGLSQIGDLQKNAFAVRRADLDRIIEKDAVVQAFTKERGAAAEAAEALMLDYKQGVETLEYDSEDEREKDMAMIEAIIGSWRDYIVQSERLLALCDEGRWEESTALAKGDARHAFESFESALDVLSSYNKEQSEESAQLSGVVYGAARRTTMITLVLVTLFSAFIFIIMTRGMSRSINELIYVSRAIGEGDLRIVSRIGSKDEFGALSSHYNSAISNIKSLISGMQSSSERLERATEELDESVARSAADTDTITANIEKMSLQSHNQHHEIGLMIESLRDMSEGVGSASRNVEEMARAARKSVEKSREGRISMERAVQQMDKIEAAVGTSGQVVGFLGEKSLEIGQIVETISGIAGQTNLLALNAAIEASRAGEQGLGFAVVANEVKKLAGESQSASERIAELITSIQEETAKAVGAMSEGKEEARLGAIAVREGGMVFGEIMDMSVESSERLQGSAEAMRDVSKKTDSIVSVVRTIEDEGRRMADNSQSVLAATQEQSANMPQLTGATREVAFIAKEMKESAQKFLM